MTPKRTIPLLKTALFCSLLVLAILSQAQKEPDRLEVRGPRVCTTVEQIKEFFRQNKIPVEAEEFSGTHAKCYFVAAFPYSGVDTIDLYCYVWKTGTWKLFTVSHVWDPKERSFKYQSEGDFIAVIDGDSAVLKLNPRIGR